MGHDGMRPAFFLALAVLATGCRTGAVSTAAAAPPPNIVLITIDTLRADRVGSYGYTPAHTPALDTLAARGARFNQAIAHAPLTVPSHVSILTGEYPSRHGARDNGVAALGPASTTVSLLLRQNHYVTGAFVGSFLLSAEYGFDRGFDLFDDEFKTTGPLLDYELRRPASAVADRAIAWFRTNAARSFFAWIHFYDPHAPYATSSPYPDVRDPYDRGVADADAGVAAVLRAIQALGLSDRTAVIVTADHGEGLGDHGEREHGLLLYDSVLRVPLIVALPGATARVVRRQVRHADLLPTILTLAGVPVPSGLPGRSLLALVREGEAAKDADRVQISYADSWYGRLHFGWSELRAVRVDGWKYIDAPRQELYDLVHDPGERVNLYTKRAELAARLHAEIRTLTMASVPSLASPGPDSDTAGRLRALGYVSGGVTGVGVPGADPKEELPLFEKYVRQMDAGVGALRAGHPERAVAALRAVATEFPASFEAHHYLGYAYAAAERYRDAVPEYERALTLNPGYAVADFDLARALSGLGERARAHAALDRGFALEPRSFYGSMTAGVVAWSAGDDRGAVTAFTRAVQVNPEEPRAHANLGEACMRTGDFRAARMAFETLVRLRYQRPAAHYNLGVIAERLGERDGARREYEAALQLDPTLGPARQALDKLR